MIPSCAPPFTALGVTFRCYIVGNAYEWLSDDRQRAAGRNEGFRTFWARVGNRRSDTEFPSLRSAMHAAARQPLGRV